MRLLLNTKESLYVKKEKKKINSFDHWGTQKRVCAPKKYEYLCKEGSQRPLHKTMGVTVLLPKIFAAILC